GRPVSFASTFSYAPAPEDAGWQQVTVEVSGRGGRRAARTWDVGVVPPTPPVLEEVTPPAGSVALARGEQGSFRCRARVPAARPGDRLAFEWMLDDRPVRREEQPAADAISDLALPPSETGSHHLRVRVTEDGQSASIAEWTVAVADQTIGRDTWVVTVLEPEVAQAAPPPLREPAPPATETAPPSVPSELAEAEVRAWLDEYARVWSRKDLSALRRMGQVRSA